MVQYILFGLALGSIYAIASAALTVTYVSSGVLNFAFGSMAYVVARFYYWLNSQHGLSTVTAGTISLVLFAPLMGMILYAVLFRFLSGRSMLIKLVTTIGLSVALPPIADLTMGTQTIDSAPGLALTSDHPFHIFGTTVSTNQVVTYGFVLFVVVAGTLILRFTDVGLKVRALVDSKAMTEASGVHPGRVALGVWAVSSALAGLAGILVAPTNGLTTTGMTTLMAAAFAAVVAARLRSLPAVVLVSLAMGVVTDVIQKYLPANSSFTAAIIPSIPFAFILVALVFYVIRSGAVEGSVGTGGPLDHALRPANQSTESSIPQHSRPGLTSGALGVIPLVVVGLLPLILHGSAYWLSLVALGMCYAVTFLTFTVVTGEGGMLWLSQVIFAGTGAIASAQFVIIFHVPVLVALVMGGVVAAAAGAVIGLLTIRLGDLYVALVTLTFGLLVETLIFTRPRFLNTGAGVPFTRPGFAGGDLAFSYLAFGIFIIFAVLILNLRRSTTGLALRAVRDSATVARTSGLSVLQVKVIVGAVAAFVAAVGGGLLALDVGQSQPQSFETFGGLVWLAVVVTLGVRSIAAAALSGMALALIPGIFSSYVPVRWAEIPTLLFGLGAVMVARNPEGVVAQNARQLRALFSKLRGGPAQTDATRVATESAAPDAPAFGGAEGHVGDPGTLRGERGAKAGMAK